MVGSRLKSPHIRFYISDHGYGHASRSIAIIRELQSQLNAQISVRTSVPAHFLKQSIPSCIVTNRTNDVGPTMDTESSAVNVDKTISEVSSFYSKSDSYIQEEVAYCVNNSVDLILSDITPWVFRISDKIGAAGIGISNFTWYDIYSTIPGLEKVSNYMYDDYGLADSAIVLPFHSDMKVFNRRKYVPLISRKIRRNRESMRNLMGIDANTLLIYIGSGLSINMIPKCLQQIISDGYSILMSGNNHITGERIYHIPQNDTETQDYIGMCDLVVTKSAYSTISEAITAKIPLLVYRREGVNEDRYICDCIEKNKIGKIISWNILSRGEWIKYIPNLISLKESYHSCEKVFMMDGIDMCINHIKEFI